MPALTRQLEYPLHAQTPAFAARVEKATRATVRCGINMICEEKKHACCSQRQSGSKNEGEE